MGVQWPVPTIATGKGIPPYLKPGDLIRFIDYDEKLWQVVRSSDGTLGCKPVKPLPDPTA
jgi:hypothetical protein